MQCLNLFQRYLMSLNTTMKERSELFGYCPLMLKRQENTEVYVKSRAMICNSPNSKQANLKCQLEHR